MSLIRTGFGGTAAADTLSGSTVSACPYAGRNVADEQMAASYRSSRLTALAEAVAAVIERVNLAARPRSRYLITAAAKFLVHAAGCSAPEPSTHSTDAARRRH